MVTKYVVDPGDRFKKSIDVALSQVSDLSPAFMQIKKGWYQSNKAIFALKGPGKYPALGGLHPDEKVKGMPYTHRQRAEARKRKMFGFDYPLLMATGRLYASLTGSGPDSIAVYNSRQMSLGTKVEYAFYHQADGERKKLPFRPFVFIGAEQTAPDEINNRQDAWVKIVQSVIASSLKNAGVGDVS
jgi:phage gpG-like protein